MVERPRYTTGTHGPGGLSISVCDQEPGWQYAQAIGADTRKVPKLISDNPMWLEPTRGESRGLTRHPGLHILKVRRRIHAV
jgi:hypothetical protein